MISGRRIMKLLISRQNYLFHYIGGESIIMSASPQNVEMPDGIKPSNAHIALANIGDEFKIVRDNMPFGNMSTNEMGTYFIAYASTFTTGYWISAPLRQAACFLFRHSICWTDFRLDRVFF